MDTKKTPLTDLTPAEREYRVLHPTRSYAGFAIASKANEAASADKLCRLRPTTPWTARSIRAR